MGRVNKIAVFLLKLAISGALVYFLISKAGGRAIIANIRQSDPLAFIAAVGMYILATLLSSLRWKLLIPIRVGTNKLFGMYMIGAFFNNYLPGIIGGDGVKAYYLSRELKAHSPSSGHYDGEKKGKYRTLDKLIAHENIISIASVFMDRYIGISALLAISMVAFPFSLKYLEGASIKWPLVWFIPSIFIIFVVASIVVYRFRIGERLKLLYRLYDYFDLYRTQKEVLSKAFAYSLAVQLLGMMAVYVLSKGLSLDVSLLSVIVFLPIVILISFIPISISGIGLREGSFVFLFGTMGISPNLSLTLSLLWFLSVVVASLWGFAEYLRFKVTESKIK